MGVRDSLRSLFGWKTQAAPVDKPKEGNPMDIGMGGNGFAEAYSNMLAIPDSRIELYTAYDELDDGEVAAVLDAYAGDATQHNSEHDKSIWVEAKSRKVREVIEGLIDRLKIDDDATAIVRDLGKDGDVFSYLTFEKLPDFDNKHGKPDRVPFQRIASWRTLDPRYTFRYENSRGVLLGFTADEISKNTEKTSPQAAPEFKPWEIVHMRRMTKRFRVVSQQRLRNIYGTSILYPAIRSARQLAIMDDLLMMHRILRSLDRHIFYIDVGTASREDEIRILKRWKAALKRKEWIDPTDRKFASKFSSLTFLEDIFWPTRAGSNSRVDTLNGQSDVANVVDHDRFLNKFYGTVRAPKGFFGHEDASGQLVSKATLSTQDVVFGRAVTNLQRHFIAGLTRLAQIELSLRGLNPDPKLFSIKMVKPSAIEDLNRIEAVMSRIDAASTLITFGQDAELNRDEWRKYVLSSVVGLSDEEIERFTAGMDKEDDRQGRDDDEESVDEFYQKIDEMVEGLPDARPDANKRG